MTSPSVSRCFPPVVNAGVRVLLLGSLPGEMSLRRNQYYGHPRNQFWTILSGLVCTNLVTLEYEDRLQCLLEHGIGLWDVIAQAERPGSLDQNIRNAVANSLPELVGSLPRLRAIGFNGSTASKLGRAQLRGESWPMLTSAPELLDLPSTSPAHTLSFERKAAAWQALERYL